MKISVALSLPPVPLDSRLSLREWTFPVSDGDKYEVTGHVQNTGGTALPAPSMARGGPGLFLHL